MPKILQTRPNSYDRGYTSAWTKARAAYLKKHPFCVRCGQNGKLSQASVVDHIVPHRSNKELFWDKSNWQPLCATCHNSFKQRIERSGKILGCRPDGFPIDPNHYWNR